jgi:pilus assembly protein CpaB
VLRRMFSQETRTSGGLAIPDGQVAVSFTVTHAEQVAGYVRPGSQVALYTQFTMVDGKAVLGGQDGDVIQTAVLLPRVDVIAVGARGAEGETTTNPLEEGEAALEGQDTTDEVLVTVAVTTEEARQVVLAASADAIHLALLSDGANPEVGVNVNPNTVNR